MLISRTTGSARVVPELVYPDIPAAIDWLCGTFGFTEVWRAGEHRARLAYGNGAVVIADDDPDHGRVAPTTDSARSCLLSSKSKTSTHTIIMRDGEARRS